MYYFIVFLDLFSHKGGDYLNKVKFNGLVKGVVYSNSENGYSIFKVAVEKNGEKESYNGTEITCVGSVPSIATGEYVEITGEIVKHPTYGEQVKVLEFQKSVPITKKGLELYLSSGIIKGIGAVLSERIVERFGDDTMHILANEPEELAKVKGITKKKAIDISKQFEKQENFRDVLIYLQQYGISITVGMKIYEKYGDGVTVILKENPYKLSEDIIGIGFKQSDAIAQKTGIEKTSIFRVRAGIKHILSESSIMGGNIYLPIELLITKTAELLEVDESFIQNGIGELAMEKQIYVELFEDKRHVFLNHHYHAERYVARKLLELNYSESIYKEEHSKLFKKIERDNQIELAPEQKEAIKQAMINGVLVITGGPGTGKTTTINSIIQMFQNMGYDVELCAPTGKASKRMTEATGQEARTIHRLLGIGFSSGNMRTQTFQWNEECPLETDVIIVDECSMIDLMLMNVLLKAIARGTRVVFVGDVDQLPSVGAGNVLKDMIDSDCIPVIRLKQIFRQARQSLIITNAHKINQGQYPELDNVEKDFFFMNRNNAEEVAPTIVELVSERLPKFANITNPREIQVLAPMKKSQTGVHNLNDMLQQALNPPCISKNERISKSGSIFREGDKVMQIKNNYQLAWISENKSISPRTGVGVFNGDEGIILQIDNKIQTLVVKFDDFRIVSYEFKQLDELELSYATTIHKSQGSEYKAVIIVAHSGPPMLLSRNLLYTALTRAKQLAVIVGLRGTIYSMVDNNNKSNRYTSLGVRMKNLAEFM